MDKRVVTIIIFFAVFAVLLITGATVFVVRGVEVSFVSAEEASVVTSDEIISASEIKTGKNIFAVSEIDSVYNIEKKYPGIKVINIERKFPSTIIIHVTARIPILAVKITGRDSYVLLDREMFAVQTVTSAELNAREELFGHEFAKSDYELGEADVTVGEIIDENASEQNAITQNFIVAYEKKGLINHGFSDYIAHIDFSNYNEENEYQIKLTTRSGLDILFDGTANLNENVALSYEWYCGEIARVGSNAETVTSGYIMLVKNENGNYYAWFDYQY